MRFRSFLLGLLLSTHGAVATEYTVIVGFVAIGAAGAIAGLGPMLLSSYDRTRGTLLLPIP